MVWQIRVVDLPEVLPFEIYQSMPDTQWKVERAGQRVGQLQGPLLATNDLFKLILTYLSLSLKVQTFCLYAHEALDFQSSCVDHAHKLYRLFNGLGF